MTLLFDDLDDKYEEEDEELELLLMMMILALHLWSRISVSSSDGWDWCHSNARHSFKRGGHWDIDCQLLVGESFTGFGSVIWALGCVVSLSKHQRSRSLPPSLSVGRWSAIVDHWLQWYWSSCKQQNRHPHRTNEWVKVVDDDDGDESELSTVMIDWSSANWIKRIDLEWLIDWVSEYLSCERLFDCMNEVCTHSHSHSLTLRHTHTQWCKYQSGDAQIKYPRASMRERLAVCVASRTKLAHTHTNIWLLLLIHWMVSVSRVCVDLSIFVGERACRYSMNDWWQNERDQVMVIESWVATLHTLSRALRARGRRATLPSWDRCSCVPQYKWERAYWLYCVIGCVCSCCTSISSSSSNERSSNTTTTTTNSSPNTNIINLNIHLLASTTKTTQPK